MKTLVTTPAFAQDWQASQAQEQAAYDHVQMQTMQDHQQEQQIQMDNQAQQQIEQQNEVLQESGRQSYGYVDPVSTPSRGY